MNASPVLLLDFDDTLSDPFGLFAQFVRAAGTRLAANYGGNPDAWADSLAAALLALEKEYALRFVNNPLAGYNDWLEAARERTSAQIFAAHNLPVPFDATAQSKALQHDALAECNALFPDAPAALYALAQQNYILHLASGQDSLYLRGALAGAGLENVFTETFGPDLIDCAKEGPEYYTRIFRQLNIKPHDALVIDDQPDALRWALQTGATAIQAHVAPDRTFPDVPGVFAILTRLADLPDIVNRTAKTPRTPRKA